MQKVNQVLKMDSDYLSGEELETAILGLSDADVVRLKKCAHKYIGGHDMDVEDLVNEAILRTLSGKRKTCPRNLPIVQFLAGAMRSIASGEREKTTNSEELLDIDLSQLHGDSDCPEENAIQNQRYKELEVIFDEDEEILMLLLYLQNGNSPSEIREEEGWSQTQFNTIRRRTRRKWNSHNAQEITL